LKQAAAIFFSAILLFNLIGYQLVSSYLQQQTDSALELRLDEQTYNEDELISFKLPLSIPYNNSSKDFERVDGEVNVKGVIYKYVKRRIYQDTLEVLCIVNKDKMQLQSAKDEFFKLCYDLKHSPTSGKKNTSGSVAKGLQLEYYYSNYSLTIQAQLIERTVYYNSPSVALPIIFLAPAGQPPEGVSC
jgi:hypothetical protein